MAPVQRSAPWFAVLVDERDRTLLDGCGLSIRIQFVV
jgi:hypothetical protein